MEIMEIKLRKKIEEKISKKKIDAHKVFSQRLCTMLHFSVIWRMFLSKQQQNSKRLVANETNQSELRTEIPLCEIHWKAQWFESANKSNSPKTPNTSQIDAKTRKATNHFESVGDRCDFGPLKSGSNWYFSPIFSPNQMRTFNLICDHKIRLDWDKRTSIYVYWTYRIHCLLQTNYNHYRRSTTFWV